MNEPILALSDLLTFSAEQFNELMLAYNAAAWPGHVLAIAGALGVYELSRTSRHARAGLMMALLAITWGWIGHGYFSGAYATLNFAGERFAVAAGAQAILCAVAVMLNPALRPDSASSRAGHALVVFGVFVMPVLSAYLERAWEGDNWQALMIYGIGPAETAVATVGAVMVLQGFGRWLLAVIPLSWCAFMFPLGQHVGDATMVIASVAVLVALVIAAIGTGAPDTVEDEATT